MTDTERWLAQVARYTRLRWVGVGLFAAGLALAALTLLAVVQGEAPAGRLLLAFAGCGLALGAFGTSDDTALVAMHRLKAAGALPAAWAGELATEEARRPGRAARAHASPRAALVIPVVDVLVLAWLAWRLGGSA